MSNEKNKNRLFITLQYRLDMPGFHWALVLSPKSESDDKKEYDSHLFHVTNSIGYRVAMTPVHGWRYEDKPVNVLSSRTITARVLVAKLSSAESVEAQAQRINHILRVIPLAPHDPSWNCVVWVQQALAVLKASRGEFSSIPNFNDGGRLEGEINDFAEKAKADILKGKMIVYPHDLALLDLRGR